MRYEGEIYRPFSEANSYLLQCTIGCSHNKCTFCGMYKNKKFRIRSLDEIYEDIAMAAKAYPETEKVFLCDGDAISIDNKELLLIIKKLNQTFPRLRHIASYVGPTNLLQKTEEELLEIKNAGLNKLYIGIESGDEQVLSDINKGVSLSEMREACMKIYKLGFNVSSMMLIGIAGKGNKSREHAINTAKLVNETHPQYLAAMTYTPVPGTQLFNSIQRGDFTPLSPEETLNEIKILIENIDIDLKFVGTHVSNFVPLTGKLPEEKKQMIDTINMALNNPGLLRKQHPGSL